MVKVGSREIDHPLRRVVLLALGLTVMAFGVALSIDAALGTSPISTVPYVTAAISGLTVGQTTIVMNAGFVLIQILILRRRYEWFQILQFPAAVLFGSMIDVAESVMEDVVPTNYVEQWVLCLIGILLIAFGISMEVTARLVTTAGEGVVLAVCQVSSVKFSNMKVAFDVTLVCIAVVLSLVFLGRLDGVREGTVAAAILVGMTTKKTNRIMDRVGERILPGQGPATR